MDAIDTIAGVAHGLGVLLLALSAAGSGYTLAAGWLVGGYRPQRLVLPAELPAITVLKPLHGSEPQLLANLQTVVAQQYPAPVQIIFGVAAANDTALAAVAALRADHPAADIAVVVDPRRHGSNAKVSNLVNIARLARHPLIVVADSDVCWPADTLARLAVAVTEPGVGLVSCLHWGRGDAGMWSVLGAMDISYRFLPAVVVGIATGLATPMLGPTFALRREVLAAIGGFAAFADRLADDYEIGRAVRGAGLRTVVPRFTIGHCGSEASARDLLRHELRWTRTIRTIDPGGFIGSGVTHCLMLAIAGALLAGPTAGSFGLVAVALALAARLLLAWRVDRVTGPRAGPLLLLPLRDLLSAGLFVATFFVTSVIWRGTRYRVAIDGSISAF